MEKPLAEILRPQELEEFIGQNHLIGKDGIITKLLSKAKASNYFPSLIFWGPPGVGKTTLARIIAKKLDRECFEFSAVSASIKEIESTFKGGSLKGEAPVVIIDEIHRFNKSQQSKLLPHVETGKIILIGATTENPSFEVITPLLSRTKVLLFRELQEKELEKIAQKGLSYLKAKISKEALSFLIESSNGDARILLNTLQIAKSINSEGETSTKDIEEALQKRQLAFDKRGEEYYNIISAFIKSMRASDVNAALYYLARMIEAGQDPLYIARRMVIFASEDVGMAQPTALVVANEVFKACEEIGYPECAINLAHGTVYLALAKKDRGAYEAYMRALEDVKKYSNLPIPLKIRNPVTKLMQEIGYGKGYKKYTKESLLPDKIKEKKYYLKENKGGDK